MFIELQCSVTCDRGQRMREVVCVTVDNIPIAENKCQGEKPIDSELCDMGSCAKTWFYTRWSEQVYIHSYCIENSMYMDMLLGL